MSGVKMYIYMQSKQDTKHKINPTNIFYLNIESTVQHCKKNITHIKKYEWNLSNMCITCKKNV